MYFSVSQNSETMKIEELSARSQVNFWKFALWRQFHFSINSYQDCVIVVQKILCLLLCTDDFVKAFFVFSKKCAERKKCRNFLQVNHQFSAKRFQLLCRTSNLIVKKIHVNNACDVSYWVYFRIFVRP